MSDVGTDGALLPAEDLDTLAREMARAYVRMVAFFRDQLKMEPDKAEAMARAENDPEWAQRAMDAPADQVSWAGLATLVERDPAAMHAVWARVKDEARVELASGHRAATTLDWEGSPWQRARFLAIRESFRAEWGPRGGIEDALIDTMAQAHSAYLSWMELLHTQSATEGKREKSKLKSEGYWEPPRIEAAAAMDQSAAMADRFHRLFLRTLRALRDLRRYGPAVVVQNAGQVNVAERQVNVAGVPRSD